MNRGLADQLEHFLNHEIIKNTIVRIATREIWEDHFKSTSYAFQYAFEEGYAILLSKDIKNNSIYQPYVHTYKVSYKGVWLVFLIKQGLITFTS